MISVGIDISKDKSTVCMLRPYGEVVEAPYNIEHTEQALNALIERIKSFDEDVKVVLEATGGYHQVVVTKLLEADIFTVVVNPYIMKKILRSGFEKSKNRQNRFYPYRKLRHRPLGFYDGILSTR